MTGKRYSSTFVPAAIAGTVRKIKHPQTGGFNVCCMARDRDLKWEKQAFERYIDLRCLFLSLNFEQLFRDEILQIP